MIKRKKEEFDKPAEFKNEASGDWHKPKVEVVEIVKVNPNMNIADFRKQLADVSFGSPNASAVVIGTLRSIRNKTLGVYVLDDLIEWLEGN